MGKKEGGVDLRSQQENQHQGMTDDELLALALAESEKNQ